MPTSEVPDESPIGAPRTTYKSHMNVAKNEILIGRVGCAHADFDARKKAIA